MKTFFNITILFFFTNFFIFAFGKKLDNNITDVWYYQVWEFEKWEFQAKHSRFFKDNGSLLEHIIQVPDTKNNWLNKYRIVYDYNEKELQTAITTFVWNEENWNYSTKLEFVYYGNNLIKERNFLLFKNGQWLNDVQFAYEYSESGNIILETFSRWTDYVWEPYTKLIYKYDSLNLNYEIINIRFLDSIWVNYGRTLNSYDSNRLLKKSTLFGWDITLKDWFYYEQNLYNYDSQNRLIEWINQQGDNDKWYNSFRETYDYTDFGSLRQKIKYRSVNYQWKNNIRLTYFYDNLQDSSLILMEDWQNDSWMNKERRIREDFLSDVYSANDSYFSIYPNPAINHFIIKIEGYSNPFLNYKILNLSGVIVQTGNLDYISPFIGNINITDLPHGLYFLILDNNHTSKSSSFLIYK